MDELVIKGARQHNLKNITLRLPKNKLIVFTGLSGSGKSSLAFDTIYAEGQRRYVESLSSYARQFLGVMDKPDVDGIEGLSPAISIDQKATSHNPRSTVGTVTEIYDYLRLLFARVGHPHCPNCGREIERQTSQQIVGAIVELTKKTSSQTHAKQVRLMILAPVVKDRKGEFAGLFDNLRAKGYRRVRVDGHVYGLDEDLVLIKTNKHTVDVVVDALALDTKNIALLSAKADSSAGSTIRGRITESVEAALALADGLMIGSVVHDAGFTIPEKPKKMEDHVFSEKFACPVCNISLPEIEPRTFSFNSPHGACPTCSGIGTILTVDPDLVINPALSISEGGILPFAKMFFHDTWYSRVIATVCKHHGIDMRAPLGRMSAKQKDALLYGTGDHLYRVYGTNRFGEQTSIEEAFSGIIPELKRRHQESQSEYMAAEIAKYMREEICQTCKGKRLKKESLTVAVDGLSIADVTALSVTDAKTWIRDLGEKTPQRLSVSEQTIAQSIIKEISSRLGFLVSVGLTYLTLARSAMSLSGGEAQRIRLASQIGSGLSGVLYVLDEPSIGLHQRDNARLIGTLHNLRDLGNSVIVVEHDKEMMQEADFIVDFGPGAGKHGGKVVAAGTRSEIIKNPQSLTGQYLSGKRSIQRTAPKNGERIMGPETKLTLEGVTHNNLKNITIAFPLSRLIAITGVSGSGKSSLIVETLYPALQNATYFQSRARAGEFKQLKGTENVDKVILIDQSPIGRTPRSNPATYTGMFTHIRDIFAMLPDARARGYKAGRFSFNVKGGRCEACEGEGQRKIEMQFLADVYVTCEVCGGTRYNQETLAVSFRGKNIAQVLDMTIDEAVEFFHAQPQVLHRLKTLAEVGLGYMHLGQSATTLSGGEAQRVKLATELARRATGRTVYILDEPTTGLHFADLEKLLHVLGALVAAGNTVIVIEHNLDVIKNADWVVDLGPEGGDEGGRVIAEGTPTQVAKIKSSYTGQFLKNVLK
jgi:excinuclease ABC subunit A